MAKQIKLVVPKAPVTPVLLVLGLLVGIIGLVTCYYTIGPEEVGVKMRFGKFAGITEPGLHFKLPYGIDQVRPIKVRRQLKQEFGFRTAEAGVRTQYRENDQRLQAESLMVTGDLNAAVVEWIVQYRIQEPKDYLFNVRNPEETLRDASESVMRRVVGDHTVDEVITVGRQQIQDNVLTGLQDMMNEYGMGIRIEQIVLQDVTPPDPVKASFNSVNQAKQERERLINQAKAQYNRVVPRARGEAEQKIQEAEGYATERVNQAQGDVARFEAMLVEYSKAPEITRQRIYLETMKNVLPKLGPKYIIDDDAPSILPFMQFSPGKEATP